MRELATSIEIEATAERVWEVLTDFAAFPEWNPFIREATGAIKQGEKITVLLGASGAKPMTFQPTLLSVIPNRELRWLGHFYIRGLFDGEHSFVIEPLEGNRVRFLHSEKFGGILIPMMAKMLDTDTRRGFEEMNAALKKRAELADV